MNKNKKRLYELMTICDEFNLDMTNINEYFNRCDVLFYDSTYDYYNMPTKFDKFIKDNKCECVKICQNEVRIYL